MREPNHDYSVETNRYQIEKHTKIKCMLFIFNYITCVTFCVILWNTISYSVCFGDGIRWDMRSVISVFWTRLVQSKYGITDVCTWNIFYVFIGSFLFEAKYHIVSTGCFYLQLVMLDNRRVKVARRYHFLC